MGQIDNLRAIASRAKGFARAAKYEVEIIAPQKHPGGTGIGREIGLQCNTITMPGHNLEQQTARYGSAPAREMVTSHTYAVILLPHFIWMRTLTQRRGLISGNKWQLVK